MFDASREIDRLMERREARIERRKVLQTATIAAAAAAAGSAGFAGQAKAAGTIPPFNTPAGDLAILNFALNLEYLEAEYYLRGTIGQPLTTAQTTGGNGAAPGGVLAPATTLVPFQTSALAYYFIGTAADENEHVNLLRSVLGTNAVAEPAIDLVNSFNTIASASTVGATFNPFESEINFLIGAYIFEDVGVTAYAGAASSLQTTAQATANSSTSYLPAAAGVLAAEGYHAGAIRGYLADIGGNSVTDAISALRQYISGVTDKGTGGDSNPYNVTNVDDLGTVQTRTYNQVLNIVYGATGTGVTKGLFFPNGVNGVLSST